MWDQLVFLQRRKLIVGLDHKSSQWLSDLVDLKTRWSVFKNLWSSCISTHLHCAPVMLSIRWKGGGRQNPGIHPIIKVKWIDARLLRAKASMLWEYTRSFRFRTNSSLKKKFGIRFICLTFKVSWNLFNCHYTNTKLCIIAFNAF